MREYSEIKVWRLSLGAPIEVTKIETALREASGLLDPGVGGTGTAELHRVDIMEDETIVFISGDESAADTFSKTLQVHSPRAKIRCSEAKATDLLKLPEAPRAHRKKRSRTRSSK